MKSISAFLLLLAVVFSQKISAQGSWTSITDFPQTNTNHCPAMTISGKGYVVGGFNNPSDQTRDEVFEYNPVANAWVQKADFPTQRTGHAAVGAGVKGYAGLGASSQSASVYNDWYEFNPAANVWTTKASFPGTARGHVQYFEIEGFIYAGGGTDYAATTFFSDWNKYDPTNNTWTAIAAFPGTPRWGACSFSVCGKGYILCGYNNGNLTDVWEYDPIVNVWNQKNNFPDGARRYGTAFSIGNKGYFGLGYSESNNQFNDFREYNPCSDTWTACTNYPQALYQPFGFVIGDFGYVGAGCTPCSQAAYKFTTPNPPAACPTNKAIQMDDINDFVELSQHANSLIFNAPATVEFWFKANFDHRNEPPGEASYGIIFSIGDGNTYAAGERTDFSFGNVTGGTTNERISADHSQGGDGLTTLVNDPNNVTGEWHHYAIVCTGSAWKYYIDGVLKTVSASFGNSSFDGYFGENIASKIKASIGADLNDNYGFLNGSLDEFRLWNTARTAAQIAANWNREIDPNMIGLVANYRFNAIEDLGQGAPGVNDVADFSGHSFHGDLIGGPTLTCDAPSILPATACPAVTFTYTKPSCPGLTNGKITAKPLPTASGCTYLWNTGATSKILSNVAAGTYTCSVTKASLGCLTVGTATLLNPLPVTVAGTITPPTCLGNSNGKIVGSATGGTGSKTYHWNTGATTATISNLPAGTYSMTATDSKGCTGSNSFAVVDPSDVVVSVVSVVPVTGGKFKVTLDATGGVPFPAPKTHRFNWRLNGSSTWNYPNWSSLKIFTLLPGNYDFAARDKNLCEDIITVAVPPPPSQNRSEIFEEKLMHPVFSISPNPFDNQFVISTNGQNQTAFQVQVFDAAGKLILERTWQHQADFLKIENTNWQPGIYFLKILDEDGSPLDVQRVVKMND